MRMNEVKSQISLVKGERNECQEVTSALYLIGSHVLEPIRSFSLDGPKPKHGFLGMNRKPPAGPWHIGGDVPTHTTGARSPHPQPSRPCIMHPYRSSHSDSDVSGLGCWSFELLTFLGALVISCPR